MSRQGSNSSVMDFLKEKSITDHKVMMVDYRLRNGHKRIPAKMNSLQIMAVSKQNIALKNKTAFLRECVNLLGKKLW